MRLLARIIARGLAVGLPLILTLAILVWLLKTIETWLGAPLRWWLEDSYAPGMGLAIGLVFVIALGVVASTWLGGRLLALVNALLDRLPLVKTIYGALKDVMRMFERGGKGDFDKAVVVDWGGRRFLGFITREDADGLPKGLMEPGDVVVYLPMGYQIGGFPILVSRKALTPIDMPVDAALKFALTAGVSAGTGGQRG
ncbi:MAG: DUF502 domain-containing protein [Pseudomonadota bacterium]